MKTALAGVFVYLLRVGMLSNILNKNHMKLKPIFLTLLLLSSVTLIQAQSKDILAKSAMLNADEAYGNKNYQECLSYLNDAVVNLGKTNSRIQHLKVKALMALGNSDQYNKALWLQADTALNKFFQVTPENGYDQEKYDEMLMAVGKVKKSIIASAEAASSLNHEIVLVHGGAFQMGSNESDNEKPVHTVTVGDFYMGKYEVTVAQFRQFINETSYRTDAEKGDGSYIVNSEGKWEKKSGVNWKCNAEGNIRSQNEYNHPVVHVSWNDANEYCNWLSRKTGKSYRLPTEAEWEYAAKGGNQSLGFTYSGSNIAGDVAWCMENSGSKTTHPVGQKQPNELGIYDMTGNVWEWCSDWEGKDYYAGSPSNNPKGPSTGALRVFRGGSWGSNARDCRAAGRSGDAPGSPLLLLWLPPGLSQVNSGISNLLS
jgi:formylglycine-generating enzyme required for sulfatase activity